MRVEVELRSRDRDHTVAVKTALNPLGHAANELLLLNSHY